MKPLSFPFPSDYVQRADELPPGWRWMRRVCSAYAIEPLCSSNS